MKENFYQLQTAPRFPHPTHQFHCTRCGDEYTGNELVYGMRLVKDYRQEFFWYCRNDNCYGRLENESIVLADVVSA